jgi:HK97 family phage portal protein
MRSLSLRALRPPDEIPTTSPGDPDGVELDLSAPPGTPPPAIPAAAPWAGWPAEWATPLWGRVQELTDVAWMCIDLNASLLATMPPYLVGAAMSLSADWLTNPDPDLYSSWEEFAKQLFWEFQLGEVYVLATARYSTGYPARFYVVPAWSVEAEIGSDGLRHFTIGGEDVTGDMLQLRYQSSVGDAHGHGPLEAGAGRMIAAQVLGRYATTLAASGGIPAGLLYHDDGKLSREQADALKTDWLTARMSSIGEPAVLSGGVRWEATQVNPADMALLDLLSFNEARIASMLGVPPYLIGVSSSESMTYANATNVFDYHWRSGLRPKAQTVMAGLSQWLLPRGTSVEVNRDAYIEPDPLVRAQTAQILNSIQDPQGNPVLTVEEIRDAERLNNTTPANLAAGVLR